MEPEKGIAGGCPKVVVVARYEQMSRSMRIDKEICLEACDI
jgi:hypothetical protein